MDRPAILKVNSPLEIGGTQIYLLGNGYAPVVTVRDPEGVAVYSGAIPFLPQDANLTSLGVVKVPDGLAEQVGMIGFFYPDPVQLDSGAYASFSPYSDEDSLLTLSVYRATWASTPAPRSTSTRSTPTRSSRSPVATRTSRRSSCARARPSSCRTDSARSSSPGCSAS